MQPPQYRPQQPQYPYPPQMPPASQRQKTPMPTLLVVAITLAAVLVGCCGLGTIENVLNRAHSNTGATQPTAAPGSTNTSAPADAVIFAPTLGGTVGDFQVKYGPAASGDGTTYNTTIASQNVALMLVLDDATQSLDGQPHIVELQAQAAGGTQWNASTASTIAKTFLPADAQYQKTTTSNGVRDYVYYSKGMAATFKSDQFTNNFGNVQVPAGTVNFSCQAVPPATSGYQLCDISIGVY